MGNHATYQTLQVRLSLHCHRQYQMPLLSLQKTASIKNHSSIHGSSPSLSKTTPLPQQLHAKAPPSLLPARLHLPAARSPIHHGTLTKMRKQRSRSRKSQCGREKGGINRPKLRGANRLRLSASAKTTRTT